MKLLFFRLCFVLLLPVFFFFLSTDIVNALSREEQLQQIGEQLEMLQREAEKKLQQEKEEKERQRRKAEQEENIKEEVSTESAKNVEITSATLRGEVEEGENITVWFVISKDSGVDCDSRNDRLYVSGSHDENDNFSKSATGLKPDTRYYFRACTDDDSGSRKKFYTNQEEIEVFEIDTNSAQNITKDSAQLGGDVEEGNNLNIWFVFSNNDTIKCTDYDKRHLSGNYDQNDNFYYNLTGLNSGMKYYYRACSSESYGRLKNFSTDKEKEVKPAPDNSGGGNSLGGGTPTGGKDTQTAYCGNGKKEGNEQCDAPDFGSTTCQSLGYDFGYLGCSSSCRIITNSCGNNKAYEPVVKKQKTKESREVEVATSKATNIKKDEVTLNGLVKNGENINVWFAISSKTKDPSCYGGGFTSIISVSGIYSKGDYFTGKITTGLNPNTKYYFESCGEGNNQVGHGRTRFFTTKREQQKTVVQPKKQIKKHTPQKRTSTKIRTFGKPQSLRRTKKPITQELVQSVGSDQCFLLSSVKYGERNNSVKRVQDFLKEQGYFTYHTATGNYFGETAKAVEKFQKDNGFWRSLDRNNFSSRNVKTAQEICNKKKNDSVYSSGQNLKKTPFPDYSQLPVSSSQRDPFEDTKKTIQAFRNAPVDLVEFVGDGLGGMANMGEYFASCTAGLVVDKVLGKNKYGNKCNQSSRNIADVTVNIFNGTVDFAEFSFKCSTPSGLQYNKDYCTIITNEIIKGLSREFQEIRDLPERDKQRVVNRMVYSLATLKGVGRGSSVFRKGGFAQKITGRISIQKAVVNTDLRGAVLNNKITIPKNWTRAKTRGEGWIYTNPQNLNNTIRVMKQGKNTKFSNHGKPYMRIEKGKNKYTDINGNITTDLKKSHIIINSIR